MTSMDGIDRDSKDIHPGHRRLEEAAFAPEGEPVSADSILRHIETCGVCSKKVELLRANRSAFLKEHPPEAFFKALEVRADQESAAQHRAFSRRWTVVGLAASALLCFGIVYYAISDSDLEPGKSRDYRSVAFKGETSPVSLQLFVSRGGGSAEPWNTDEPLHEGDILKFGIKSEIEGFVVIANLDDRGAVSLYHPLDKAPPFHLTKGAITILKDSIILDQFIGREVIVAFVSPVPLDVAKIEDALKNAYRKAKGDLRRIEIHGGEAAMAFAHITKVAP